MKLQKREKILLLILLAIVVALVPIVFLIMPALQVNTALAEQLSGLEMQQTEMRMELDTLPALREAQSEKEQVDGEDAALMPAPMKSYDINYFVEDICSGAGVTLNALSIGDYTPLKITGADGTSSESAILYQSEIQLTVNGTPSQLLTVMDRFADCPYAEVTSFYIDLSQPEEATDPAAQPVTQSTLPVPTVSGTDQTVITVNLYGALRPGDAAFPAPADPAAQESAAPEAPASN